MKPNIKISKKNIRYFLSSNAKGRDAVAAFINVLAKVGDVGIYGGMPRDLVNYKVRDFNSDLDIVIFRKDEFKFNKLMNLIKNIKRSKFGAYRFTVGEWQVDLWSGEDSILGKEQNLKIRDFNDLIAATFLNADSIVYHVNDDQIFCSSNYQAFLEEKILDINYPFPVSLLGAYKRILRFSHIDDVSISPRLSKYLIENYDALLINKEYLELSHQNKSTQNSIKRFMSFLEKHFSEESLMPFRINPTLWEKLKKPAYRPEHDLGN